VTRSLRAAVLKTIDIAKWFIARTKTATGLRVVAEIARRGYDKGLKASDAFLSSNPIQLEAIVPALNYTAPALDWLEWK
jgi:hypothetical protein